MTRTLRALGTIVAVSGWLTAASAGHVEQSDEPAAHERRGKGATPMPLLDPVADPEQPGLPGRYAHGVGPAHAAVRVAHADERSRTMRH
jgi:hypothetical protein